MVKGAAEVVMQLHVLCNRAEGHAKEQAQQERLFHHCVVVVEYSIAYNKNFVLNNKAITYIGMEILSRFPQSRLMTT